ncbi:MAG: hypothetical protein ACLQPH_04560 [Acidimicrobiales bacterium]
MTGFGALPALPTASCPSAAASLGAAGLGPICQAASGVTGLAGSAASQVTGFGVDSVLGALGTWVADGASWLLGQIGVAIGQTTSVDLGASWFTVHYGTMAALAGVVVVPLLLLGVIQSVYRQSASMLLRSVLVNVPLALLLTAVAVKLVQLGLALTDAMSAAVAQGAGLDSGHFLSAVTLELSVAQSAGAGGVPAFVLFLGALAVVIGALLVWVELMIRAAAVYVAVLFLPLALASLAWPAISHWCRRLVDTLVALILGKFVIASVLSLAVGALAGGTGSTAAGSGPGSAGAPGGGFTAVLGGAALLLLAAFAPWALFRLLPFLEAGAVGHLEGLSQRARHSVIAPTRALAHEAIRASTRVAFAAGAASEVGGGLRGAVTGALATVPGSGSGGGTPAGPGPDPGLPTAATTGVGATVSPGHDIPVWAAHPEATAAAEFYLGGGAAVGDPGDGAGFAPAGGPAELVRLGAPFTDQPESGQRDRPAGATRPLPRQSGALRADALGRDELGPRLIAAPQTPTGLRRPPAETDRHGDGGRGG